MRKQWRRGELGQLTEFTVQDARLGKSATIHNPQCYCRLLQPALFLSWCRNQVSVEQKDTQYHTHFTLLLVLSTRCFAVQSQYPSPSFGHS